MNHARFMSHTRQPLTGLAAEAKALAPWFHNVHLPDGTCTAPEHPLGDFPSFKWAEIGRAIPEDLHGWTALDIGCNSGFYSVELARRGAQVTALDKDPHFLRQARWVIDRFGLGSQIEVVRGQVYELSRWRTRFDLILFLGVFYHLRYPVLALDLVAEHTDRMLVFQTLTMPGMEVVTPPDDLDLDGRETMTEPGWPKMAFIEKSLEGDPTNWWAPNHACIEGLLRTAGLKVTNRPGHEMYVCVPSAGTKTEESGWDPDELRCATGRTAEASDPGRALNPLAHGRSAQ